MTHAGIGGVTALKLVQKHECLEKVLESMKESKYQIPDPFPFDEARRLFKGASSSAVCAVVESHCLSCWLLPCSCSENLAFSVRRAQRPEGRSGPCAEVDSSR